VAPANSSNLLFAADECALQAKILLTPACNPNILLQAPTTYSSDWVWSYELGEKSSFFDHRMIANVNAYWESWQHPQVATNLAGFGLTANGASAHIKGVEAQLQALLPWGFDIALNGAYTDATFVQGSSIIGFPAGTQVPDMPKVSASAVLSWQRQLKDESSLFASLEEDYVGTRTDAPFGETITLDNVDQLLVHLPAYSIVNLRFGIRHEKGSGNRWTAALFVNNLTNKQALLDPQPQIALQTSAFARYTITRPLTAGVDVTYQFH
jgi:iron complex outermembrane recepter protein